MRVLRIDSAVLWGDGAEAGVVVNQSVNRQPLITWSLFSELDVGSE